MQFGIGGRMEKWIGVFIPKKNDRGEYWSFMFTHAFSCKIVSRVQRLIKKQTHFNHFNSLMREMTWFW